MAALTVQLRDLIYNKIVAKKAAKDYVKNNFDVVKAWYPYQRLEELAANRPNGVLYLIGQSADDNPNQGRFGSGSTAGGHVLTKEIPVMFGFLTALTGFRSSVEILTVDTLVELVEQIQATCFSEIDNSTFSFIRNEYMKDENGLPFSYVGMRETATFESYFMTYFRVTVSS